MLEGLKVYLTLDNCVFVLGMNEKTVENALARRLHVPSNPTLTKARSVAYLEKLCQNVWRLPAIHGPAQVLSSLLADPVLGAWVLQAVTVADLPCVPANPRRLKGLANLIARLSTRLPDLSRHAPNDYAVLETRLLIIVAYIYQFHHDLYVRWDGNIDFFDVIRDWCDGADFNFPFFDSLVLPMQKVNDDAHERTATPQVTTENTHPDPTESNVFWIQPLILALGTEVTASQFRRYLHGGHP